MSPRPMRRVLQQLRQVARAAPLGERPDAELLCGFVDQGDEAAFTALVRRHAALVLGVCRRVTGDEHDAEDAFQAVFCVFLRKASSIRRREVLGSWLYGVAYRTALAAKARRARTRQREHQVDVMPQPLVMPPEPEPDWQPLLDAALERLPDKYRVPIILCDLEGKSRKEAAHQLHMAEGTLSSRLARGRRMLAGRLKRRGLQCSGGALAGLLEQSSTSAQVPAALVQSVAQAGAQVLTGQAPAALAYSAQVLALTEGVMKAMLVGKLKTLTLALFAGAALALGGAWMWGAQAGQIALPAALPADGPRPGGAANRDIATTPIGNEAAAVDALQYRVEMIALLADAGGQMKAMAAPAATVPLGQRILIRHDGSFASTQPQPTLTAQLVWTIEVVRQRGSEVLLNLRIEKKERRTNALVVGQSAEFEDFIVLSTWKEISDPSGAGMAFKVKVSPLSFRPDPPPPLRTKADPTDSSRQIIPPATQQNSASPTSERATFTIYHLRHVRATQVAESLQKLVATRPNLRVVADPRTNSVLVRAEGADHQFVADAIGKLDVFAPPATAASVPTVMRVFALQNVDPRDMLGILREMFPEAKVIQTQTAGGQKNVIAYGTAKTLDEVAAALQQLDRPAATAPAVPAPKTSSTSPDGKRVAVAVDNVIILLDSASGKTLAKIQEDAKSRIQSLAFSPDGKLLASGNGNGSAALWDPLTGKQVRAFQKLDDRVIRVEFALDNAKTMTLLIVTTQDQARHTFDLATGKLLRVENVPGR